MDIAAAPRGLRGVAERVKRSRGVVLASAVHRRYGADDAGIVASAIAFNGFLSVFPLLLLAASMIGFVLAGHPAAQADWTRRIAGAVPGLGGIIGDNLSGLVEHRASTGIAGLAGLAWSGTAVVRTAGAGLDRVFRVQMPKGLLRSNAWAASTLAVLGLAWTASMGVAGALGALARNPIEALGVACVAFAADAGAFVLTYRLLVGGHGPPWRALMPGALLAAAGWTVLKLAGAWYVLRTVSNARAVYGAFATTIGVLAMLMLGARILMYGGELNAVLIERGGAPVKASRRDEIDGIETNGDRTTFAIVRDIATDTGTLVRKEVELAKQEIIEAIGARAKLGGAFAAAGVLGLMALMFAGHAAAYALFRSVDPWAAYAIVAGALIVLAGVAILVARALRMPSIVPEETRRTVKEDVEWARAQLKR